MPTAKQRDRIRFSPEVRREQILDEAMRIIGQRGYYGFGIQELAQRCGVTNAGLLYHFGSKDQLLVALLQDRDRRDAEAVTSIVGLTDHRDARGKLTIETVLKLLRAIVQRNSKQPELVRLYAVLRAEALNQDHPAREYFDNREATTLKLFTRMITPHVEQPRSTARQLLAFMGGLEEQWLRAEQHFSLLAEWDRGVMKILRW